MRKKYVMAVSHKEMRGFEYLVYSVFSLALLIVLVFLPLAPVFADELAPPTDISNTSSPDTPVDKSTTEPESTENVADTPATQNSADIVDDPTLPDELAEVLGTVPETAHTDAPLPEVVSSEHNNNSADSQIDTTETVTQSTDQTSVPVPLETPVTNIEINAQNSDSLTTSTETISDDTVLLTEQGTTTTEVPFDEQLFAVADAVVDTVSIESTSTPVEAVADSISSSSPALEVSSVTTDENRFVFSKQDCTSAGDNMYYCSGADTEIKPMQIDRVFSAQDETGDKEIFMEQDSVLTQITKNDEDDDAPYYDELSNMLVWHRLIDGRYQIVSYDTEREVEEVITRDRYNNMDPHRYGAVTVWQGWVGNDWEIMMLDGTDLTMLTDNTTNDITPSINGDYIVWQSFLNGVWRMKVYDIRTKHIETIEDANGGSIENPRFVLVYDTKFESGDVETRGYNLESGEVVPLASTPAPVPKEIPEPDQTGEKRALVSPTNQPKPKTDDELNGDPVPLDFIPEVDQTDVVVPIFIDTENSIGDDDSTVASTTEVVIDSASSTDHISDIIIESSDIEATSTTDHIIDVIITPYTEPIEQPTEAEDTAQI